MDLICAASHPVVDQLKADSHNAPTDTDSVAAPGSPRCRNRRTNDLYTCDNPLECTRATCFPDEHWTDVTAYYYDEYSGHLRS